MSFGILLLEFALLGFIAAVYYIARRDLTAAAAREQAETTQALREVQETITSLVSVLQNEASAAERKLIDQTRQAERLLSQLQQSTETTKAGHRSQESLAGEESPRASALQRNQAQPAAAADAPLHRSAPAEPSAIELALQLMKNGETTLSAARQTALTVTEVEMASRMRGLQQQQPETPPAPPAWGEPG